MPDDLSVIRLPPGSAVPGWALASGFYSITRTVEELSVVCPTARVPDGIDSEGGWCAIKVRGPLPFGQIGVLAGLTDVLARNRISVFVISTYDTDYVLVKRVLQDRAIGALADAGHTFERA